MTLLHHQPKIQTSVHVTLTTGCYIQSSIIRDGLASQGARGTYCSMCKNYLVKYSEESMIVYIDTTCIPYHTSLISYYCDGTTSYDHPGKVIITRGEGWKASTHTVTAYPPPSARYWEQLLDYRWWSSWDVVWSGWCNVLFHQLLNHLPANNDTCRTVLL